MSKKGFILPKAFKQFKKELEIKILDDLVLSLKLPSSLDNAWAVNLLQYPLSDSRAVYEFIPRIISTCLVKVNGRHLMHMVGEDEKEFRAALNPNFRSKLNEEAHGQVCQWIYENIIGEIPYELLEIQFHAYIAAWIESAGGILDLPSGGEEDPMTDKEFNEKLDEAAEGKEFVKDPKEPEKVDDSVEEQESQPEKEQLIE